MNGDKNGGTHTVHTTSIFLNVYPQPCVHFESQRTSRQTRTRDIEKRRASCRKQGSPQVQKPTKTRATGIVANFWFKRTCCFYLCILCVVRVTGPVPAPLYHSICGRPIAMHAGPGSSLYSIHDLVAPISYFVHLILFERYRCNITCEVGVHDLKRY